MLWATQLNECSAVATAPSPTGATEEPNLVLEERLGARQLRTTGGVRCGAKAIQAPHYADGAL